jgi:hypothetical protein
MGGHNLKCEGGHGMVGENGGKNGGDKLKGKGRHRKVGHTQGKHALSLKCRDLKYSAPCLKNVEIQNILHNVLKMWRLEVLCTMF